MKDFNGKIAAITGAGSGMGQWLAILLAREGCHLALADVVTQGLNETGQLCCDANSQIRTTQYQVDVSSRNEVESWAKQVVTDHGAVDLLFNNAGVSVTDTVEHLSYDDFEWLMQINFWGVVYGCKAFLPFLKLQPEAHIINTSSIFGIIALPSQAAYNASKFAVRGFSEAFRQELRDTSVAVSTVHPGGVKTNIVKSSRYVPSDNEAPTREEFVTRFEQMAQLTAEQAATKILDGVRKGRPRILVGNDARIISIIERLAPVGYTRLFAKLFGN